MILLDTNVISELMRPRPDPWVESWLAAQSSADLFTTTITEAELRYGIAVLPAGHRREQLQTALAAMFDQDFAGLVLPFDSAAAVAYATLAADRRRLGRPISHMDAQIAAIARSKAAKLATRNVGDFQDCGIITIDPWNA